MHTDSSNHMSATWEIAIHRLECLFAGKWNEDRSVQND